MQNYHICTIDTCCRYLNDSYDRKWKVLYMISPITNLICLICLLQLWIEIRFFSIDPDFGARKIVNSDLNACTGREKTKIWKSFWKIDHFPQMLQDYSRHNVIKRSKHCLLADLEASPWIFSLNFTRILFVSRLFTFGKCEVGFKNSKYISFVRLKKTQNWKKIFLLHFKMAKKRSLMMMPFYFCERSFLRQWS